MAGSARPSAPEAAVTRWAPALLLVLAAAAAAQDLYKYQDEDGNWIYSDKRPADAAVVESRELSKSEPESIVDVDHSFDDEIVTLTARNDFFAPVEVRVEFTNVQDLVLPGDDHPLTWVLPPRSETLLLELPLSETAVRPVLEYQYRYMPGDPRATHAAREPYRAPFAMATQHRITQAYPDGRTHRTPDSYYAVDFAMPIGTDIVAARAGVVFAVASTNFRSGLNPEIDGPAANVVRILHDDGTYAIYAHLNTNSIRVKPGDVVERGQYIADSGNTGFSSGPHLHFAVVRNVGLEVASVPVTFLGQNSDGIVPASGNVMTAH
jgi:murein DD-endopeptidase MepM/ murein hydrolase activator NlpD